MTDFQGMFLPDVSDAKLSMAYPSGRQKLPDSGVVLAADVGGTKTNLALFRIGHDGLKALKGGQRPTEDHASFVNAVKSFHEEGLPKPDAACFGVAGPVIDNKVEGINFAWEIDGNKLKRELKIDKVSLINDLVANAYGLSAVEDDGFETIVEGASKPGNAAVLSPGTGLGEAGMFWDGAGYHPYATEGGHCAFCPRDERDFKFWKYLNDKFGRVSWERILSGHGLYDIYLFLRRNSGIAEPAPLTEKLQNQDPPLVISEAAMDHSDPVCRQALELFVEYLALEASQLALKTIANGGVYLGGGIVPDIIGFIDNNKFRDTFVNVGRMEDLLSDVPVKVILNDKTALMGAAYFAAMNL